PDDQDAFPLDSSEDTDTDGDGIGDNIDTDIDGDGTPNDEDAFPYDPTEDTDTDGDGIGDNADPDDDNDGIFDVDDDFPKDTQPSLVPAEAFTPDGNGINDTWVIPGINNYPNSLVKVYNRWGHEVYAAKGYRNDWDGTYKSNSEKLPPGSYLYVIDLGNGMALLKGWIFI
ncbi:gliding motility-associated C-terminal domain-containing protein, partial [Confluentibacter sediminis]|uniref:T9SS type B sorting domain-containing protein n=1 Tax=Confluentibacter sediminis TaxID=2219045 RepID=UPI0013A6E42D